MRFRAASFFSLTCLISLVASANPIDLFIMAGQSNMGGNGIPANLPMGTDPQADIPYDYWIRGTNGLDYEPAGLVGLQPNVAQGTSYGSEMTFARTLADTLTQSVAIMKLAAVGTGLERWWRPGRPLYDNLLAQVDDTISLLEAQGYTPQLKAFIWIQGTADTRWDLAAMKYEENLGLMVNGFRDHFNAPNLLFIQNQQHIGTLGDYLAQVRQAKADYTASDPYAHLVNIDDLPLRADETHIDSDGHLTLGYRLADTYLGSLRVLPEPTLTGWFLLSMAGGLARCGRARP